MNNPSEYKIPKIWSMDMENGGKFSNINRPTSGPTHEKALPAGKHPFQLYSLATPNGIKVTIMLEELLELGYSDAEYDAWLYKISDGDQFSSGFVEINPNSKIPALLDNSKDIPQRVFESGSILLYLAENFKVFLGDNKKERTECLSWLFWQMGSAPYLGGGFGHFYTYAPEKIKYAIDRYTMETKRQLDVLNQHLEKTKFVSGPNYTIADIAIWSWYGQLVLGRLYNAKDFLDVTKYKHLVAWAENIDSRPAVKRGRIVNSEQLKERHDSSDFIP